MNFAVDIHTHVVPADFPAYAGKHGGAFAMVLRYLTRG